MARSRRSRAAADEAEDTKASGRRGRGSRRSRAVEAVEADSAEESGGSRSSRRTSARSSNRKSSRKSSRKSRKTKSEGPSKAGAFFKGLLLFIVIVGVLAGGVFLYMELREKPQTVSVDLVEGSKDFTGTKAQLASQFFGQAIALQKRVDSALAQRQPSAAETQLQDIVTFLQRPELGSGSPEPSPEDEAIGDLNLAIQAGQMMAEIGQYEDKIQYLKDEKAAEANKQRILRRVDKLDQSDDLDGLEEDIERFLLNPVDPNGGSDAKQQEAFATKIQEVEPSLFDLRRERVERLLKETTDVVQAASLEAKRQIGKKRFSAAIESIQLMADKHPEADMTAVRETVVNSAEQSWNKEKTVAANIFADATAAGTDRDLRTRKIDEAIGVLQEVVDNYGSEFSSYISEAEGIIGDYRSQQ